jgi:hypothetical protein
MQRVAEIQPSAEVIRSALRLPMVAFNARKSMRFPGFRKIWLAPPSCFKEDHEIACPFPAELDGQPVVVTAVLERTAVYHGLASS